MATDIGNALYEQRMDRKGEPANYGIGKTHRNKLEGDSMDLDATEENLGKTRVKCYSCEKIGHKKKDCPTKIKTAEALEIQQEGELRYVDLDELYAQQTNTHENLSWTACYDDECQTHLSEKTGSGWFPKKSSKRSKRSKKRSVTPYSKEEAERRNYTESGPGYEEMIRRLNEWTEELDFKEPTVNQRI